MEDMGYTLDPGGREVREERGGEGTQQEVKTTITIYPPTLLSIVPNSYSCV